MKTKFLAYEPDQPYLFPPRPQDWLPAGHRDLFAKVFVQVFQIVREAKLVKLGVSAIDGTKVKANTNKHKAMSQSAC